MKSFIAFCIGINFGSLAVHADTATTADAWVHTMLLAIFGVLWLLVARATPPKNEG